MSALQISLLGRFHLVYDGTPIRELNQARQQALLAYLLLNASTPQSRQHLAFLFWPDTGEVQALTNLRNLLYKLRQTLPDPDHFLHADAQSVQWRLDASFDLDVTHFESLAGPDATQADLEEAIQLYRGDLLPACYDDWIQPWRLRLHQTATAICVRLIDLLEEKRAYARAISYGQQLLHLDPLDETTYRRLMQLHALYGDQAGALRVYHTCVTTLQRELGVAPGPTTCALYERLWSVVAPELPRPSAPQQTPVVGRDQEWLALQRAWRNACTGSATCMVITGEAGIGKTRLCEELVAWVGRQGYPVATAQCFAVEGALAYAPVATWLRSQAIYPLLSTLEPGWLAEVARLLPEMAATQAEPASSGAAESWQRQRLFEGLARAMLCCRKPLLLFIDDLQWSDRDTLEWIHFLLRFERQSPLMLLATVRQEELSTDHPLRALLLAMRRENHLIELGLGPLGREAIAALATAVAGQSLDVEQIEHLVQQTEGNPLFIVEFTRAQAELTEIGDPAGASSRNQILADASPLPPKVQSVIQTRLAQLSPEARELAELAATIGREFTFSVLARASGQEEESLVRYLDELWQRSVVREEGMDAYNFTHDKLREGAYTSLSAARRRLLHRRVAQALESLYTPSAQTSRAHQADRFSGQIATHYELSGQFEQAVFFYQRAAEVAQRIFANQDAILYYRRAVALLEGSASFALPLASEPYERFADLLHLTGSVDEANVIYSRILFQIPHLDPISQARFYRKIGNTWRDQYRYTEALDVYQKAEDLLKRASSADHPHQPAWWHEWIQVQFETYTIYYWLGQIQAGLDLLHRLEPAVAQHGTLDQQASFYTHRASIALRANRNTTSEEMMADVRRWLEIEQVKKRELTPASQFLLGFFFLWDGDIKLSEEYLLAALRQAEQRSDISLQARCLTYLTILYRRLGQVTETQKSGERALAIAVAAQMPEYIGLAQANEAWVAWRRGEFHRAGEAGRAALVRWEQLPSTHASLPYMWTALWPLIGLALREEKLSTAVEYLRMLLDPSQQRLPEPLTVPCELAIQAWDRDEPAEANQQIQRAVEMAQQFHYL
jgi:DNA-binding SARP family transcriptional activator